MERNTTEMCRYVSQEDDVAKWKVYAQAVSHLLILVGMRDGELFPSVCCLMFAFFCNRRLF